MPNKAIFMDRDDTLIEDPGYINDPEQVKLLEGAPEALIAIRAMGYKLVVVSNQSAVARGIVTEEILAQIHKRLEQLLAEKGTSLDRIYYCPYHPDGVIPKYRRDSDHRKPNPGMLLDAAKDMDIDLTESWMVGNSPRDIEAGARAGCKTILIDNRGHEQKIQPGEQTPDYRAVNMKEVVNIIKMHTRSTQKSPAAAVPVEQPDQQVIQEPQQLSLQQQAGPPQQIDKQPTTEQLLISILDHLKQMQRSRMFGESEFSILRFAAGVVQVAAVFCLLIGVWFLLGPDKQTDRLLIALGFAAVLQMTALTLYITRGLK
ncbi:MAG: HAD family hydrolase [Sedimentisphaerales bacterium]|jgi:D,D-heptose 1,7-bisphosphate phosphatase